MSSICFDALPSVRVHEDAYSTTELCESQFVMEVYLLHSNDLIARCPLAVVTKRSRYFNGLVNFKVSENGGDDTPASAQVEGDDFSICETICEARIGKTPQTYTAYRFFIDEREKDRISLLVTIFFFRTLCSKPEDVYLKQLNMIYNAHFHLYHIAVYYQYDDLLDKLVSEIKFNLITLGGFTQNEFRHKRFINLNRCGLVAFDAQSALLYLIDNPTDAKMCDITNWWRYYNMPCLSACDAERLRRMASLSSIFTCGISLLASYDPVKSEFVVANFHHLELGGLMGWDFGGRSCECHTLY